MEIIIILLLCCSTAFGSLASVYGKCNQPDIFCCKDGRGLPKRIRCDGETHCPDGEDEAGCSPTEIVEIMPLTTEKIFYTTTEDPISAKDSEQFQCNSSVSIHQRWVCDGKKDCENNADEDPAMCGLEEYDFIVIGAGTAGSLLASRLSEKPDWNILLLEAGGDPPYESQVPGLYSSLQGTRADWQFYAKTSKACRAKQDGFCYWPRGKMLGGTGSLNAMVYVRGNKQNYDYWSELGNPGWDYESVLPYFKKSESNQNASFVRYQNGRYHSATGPMKIDIFGEFLPTDQIFIDAASENGLPLINDINSDKTIGYLNHQGTVYNGRRVSTANSYLAEAKHRPNLHVMKHAFVKKILINSRKEAYGVKFNYKGRTMRVFSRKEVILSAGAIMSPVLLMLSGIGSKDQLEKHKIPAKVYLNGVGKNLYDHPVLRLFFTFNPTEAQPSSELDSFYEFLNKNTGSLASHRNVAGFLNSKNDSKYADISFYQAYFTRNNSGYDSFIRSEHFNEQVQSQLLALNTQNDVAVIFIDLLQPKSSGFVKLNGTNIHNKPIIRPKYFSQNEDMETMLREVKRQISFTNSRSYRKYGGNFVWLPLEACKHFEMKSDAYLECYVQQFTTTAYHPAGTCKMGPVTDSEAVVDPRLRVYGVGGLRVVDASIMPYIPSAKTNAPTCMIAEKASDYIKSQYQQIYSNY